MMVSTLKPEGLKTELINLLRWEDDGGKSIEADYGTHDTFLQWNKQFVIEPFQAGTRIDLIRKKPSMNHRSM
jgi:hypothetical protein